MSATLRCAFLIVPALVLATAARPHAQTPPSAPPSATTLAADAGHADQINYGPAVPSPVAADDASAIEGAWDAETRRRHQRGLALDPIVHLRIGRSVDGESRARAGGRAHDDFRARRHAERANRYVFGSTAPPAIL